MTAIVLDDVDLDTLVADMLSAIEHGMTGPVRHAGITGQTIEAQMRGSVRQVTEFDLERIRDAIDAITALWAKVAELEDALDANDGHGGLWRFFAHKAEKFATLHAEAIRERDAARARASLPDVDDLAQIIRIVNGSNSLGAGALAEAIIAALFATPQPEPRDEIAEATQTIVMPVEGSAEWEHAVERGMDYSRRAVSRGITSEQHLELRLTYALAAALRALLGQSGEGEKP